jgi:hypothetical protein
VTLIFFCFVYFALLLLFFPAMSKSNSDVIRKSISLSGTVAEWADELAHKKGFGSNYSAYIADLIRHDKLLDSLPPAMGAMLTATADTPSVSSVTKNQAADQIVAVVRRATARRK